MKCLRKEDLIILLSNSDRNIWDTHDLDTLLNIYGDDWYIEGGKQIKTSENQNMINIRKLMTGDALDSIRGDSDG